jgi:hypothetical protein
VNRKGWVRRRSGRLVSSSCLKGLRKFTRTSVKAAGHRTEVQPGTSCVQSSSAKLSAATLGKVKVRLSVCHAACGGCGS